MLKKTYYDPEWEDPQKYPDFSSWILKEKNENSFSCKLCGGSSLRLGNMAMGAVKKHMTYSKHQKNVTNVKSQVKIYFTANKVSESCGCSDFTKSPNLAEPTSCTIQKLLFSNPVLPSVVTKAEILFAIQSVMSHFTHNSWNDFPALFKLIFPDSEIVLKILLGRTKLGHVINYGLASYFRGKLFNSLKLESVYVTPKFTSCFDESFNRISNRKQLDVHLIYFDYAGSLVKRR